MTAMVETRIILCMTISSIRMRCFISARMVKRLLLKKTSPTTWKVERVVQKWHFDALFIILCWYDSLRPTERFSAAYLCVSESVPNFLWSFWDHFFFQHGRSLVFTKAPRRDAVVTADFFEEIAWGNCSLRCLHGRNPQYLTAVPSWPISDLARRRRW